MTVAEAHLHLLFLLKFLEALYLVEWTDSLRNTLINDVYDIAGAGGRKTSKEEA